MFGPVCPVKKAHYNKLSRYRIPVQKADHSIDAGHQSCYYCHMEENMSEPIKDAIARQYNKTLNILAQVISSITAQNSWKGPTA